MAEIISEYHEVTADSPLNYLGIFDIPMSGSQAQLIHSITRNFTVGTGEDGLFNFNTEGANDFLEQAIFKDGEKIPFGEAVEILSSSAVFNKGNTCPLSEGTIAVMKSCKSGDFIQTVLDGKATCIELPLWLSLAANTYYQGEIANELVPYIRAEERKGGPLFGIAHLGFAWRPVDSEKINITVYPGFTASMNTSFSDRFESAKAFITERDAELEDEEEITRLALILTNEIMLASAALSKNIRRKQEQEGYPA
ncbi:hypothetical protein JW978_00010 [Candidatus Dojkabacteria bacterium]|nr:hypothetical protein [Candidatus Dojkabacteria bacterium]